LVKYAGLTAIAAFAGVSVLHHVVMGANRVTPEDEEHAKELTEGGRP